MERVRVEEFGESNDRNKFHNPNLIRNKFHNPSIKMITCISATLMQYRKDNF